MELGDGAFQRSVRKNILIEPFNKSISFAQKEGKALAVLG